MAALPLCCLTRESSRGKPERGNCRQKLWPQHFPRVGWPCILCVLRTWVHIRKLQGPFSAGQRVWIWKGQAILPEDSPALGFPSQGDALAPDSGADMRDEADNGWEMAAAPGCEEGLFPWSQTNPDTSYPHREERGFRHSISHSPALSNSGFLHEGRIFRGACWERQGKEAFTHHVFPIGEM